MRKIVFVIFILFIFASSVFAEEIYTYKDKDGITVISNTPVPEKYEKKAKKIESYKRSSPAEIQRYQTEQAAIEQRREAETQANEAKAAAEAKAPNHTTFPDTSGWTEAQGSHPSGWIKNKNGGWELPLSGGAR